MSITSESYTKEQGVLDGVYKAAIWRQDRLGWDTKSPRISLVAPKRPAESMTDRNPAIFQLPSQSAGIQ